MNAPRRAIAHGQRARVGGRAGGLTREERGPTQLRFHFATKGPMDADAMQDGTTCYATRPALEARRVEKFPRYQTLLRPFDVRHARMAHQRVWQRVSLFQ